VQYADYAEASLVGSHPTLSLFDFAAESLRPCLALAPLLGMFETMMPASLIGMYGGMLFAMRDSMAAGSATLAAAAVVGAIFGAIVVLAVKVYNRVLCGAVLDTTR